jgi:hypothetical protein
LWKSIACRNILPERMTGRMEWLSPAVRWRENRRGVDQAVAGDGDELLLRTGLWQVSMGALTGNSRDHRAKPVSVRPSSLGKLDQ